jgi:integrase
MPQTSAVFDRPTLWQRLEAAPGIPARALQFLLLCGTPRSGEIVKARWSEINADNLHVPAERVKSDRDRFKMKLHVHGLRACFSGWVTAHATSVQDHDAAEACLDHVIGTRVGRAYDRGDPYVERRALLERRADFLGAVSPRP